MLSIFTIYLSLSLKEKKLYKSNLLALIEPIKNEKGKDYIGGMERDAVF
jgi:hypothetical protein